jgi:hypothetical protein
MTLFQHIRASHYPVLQVQLAKRAFSVGRKIKNLTSHDQILVAGVTEENEPRGYFLGCSCSSSLHRSGPQFPPISSDPFYKSLLQMLQLRPRSQTLLNGHTFLIADGSYSPVLRSPNVYKLGVNCRTLLR